MLRQEAKALDDQGRYQEMSLVVVTADEEESAQKLQVSLAGCATSIGVVSPQALEEGFTEWERADLIVLLPAGANAPLLELCRRYKDGDGSTPILVVNEGVAHKQDLRWLDAGADACESGMQSISAVIGRINSLLKRPYRIQGKIIYFKDLVVDTRLKTVRRNGTAISLRPKEFALLEQFLKHPRKLYSATDLLDCLWRSSSLANEETVRTHIKTLRKKIAPSDSIIKTVVGSGYMLDQ